MICQEEKICWFVDQNIGMHTEWQNNLRKCKDETQVEAYSHYKDEATDNIDTQKCKIGHSLVTHEPIFQKVNHLKNWSR